MAEYRAQIPSAYASVGMARRAITAFAREWFSGDQLSDIESAVGEALANCAEHGNAGDSTHIDIRCRYDGRELCIEIKDSGPGFERWNVGECVKPPGNSPRGYGTYIMRRMMDEIEYTERGTRVRLVKRVAVADAAGSDERSASVG